MLHPSRIFSALAILFLVCAAWLTIEPIIKLGSVGWWLGTAIILVIIFWRIRLLRYILFVLLVVLAALFSVYRLTPGNSPEWWNIWVGKTVDQKFVITDEPQVVGKTQTFSVQDLNGKIKGKIGVSTTQLPLYHFGDVVMIKGKVKGLDQNTNQSYAKSHGIVAELSFPLVVTQNQSYPKWWQRYYYRGRSFLIGIKNAYVAKIGQILPEPQAGLLSGIIFGTKAELSSYLISLLAITGTVHIIALSGYNITIIANSSKFVTKNFGRNLAFWGPTLGIIAFVLATGFSASVIRAAIMGVLLLLAVRIGRQPDALNAILFASVVMVAQNPYILIYDVGFQLSFAAVIGIIFFAPLLESPFRFFGPILGPILAGTVAAQIFSWPVIAYAFGIISLIGIVANALILPIIPLVMLVGFLTATIGFISLWLARMLGLFSWFFLSYIIKTVEYLGTLSFAAVQFKFTDPLLLLGYFLLILELTYFFYIRKRKRDAEQAS